jgi:hypothetical protein
LISESPRQIERELERVVWRILLLDLIRVCETFAPLRSVVELVADVGCRRLRDFRRHHAPELERVRGHPALLRTTAELA